MIDKIYSYYNKKQLLKNKQKVIFVIAILFIFWFLCIYQPMQVYITKLTKQAKLVHEISTLLQQQSNFLVSNSFIKQKVQEWKKNNSIIKKQNAKVIKGILLKSLQMQLSKDESIGINIKVLKDEVFTISLSSVKLTSAINWLYSTCINYNINIKSIDINAPKTYKIQQNDNIDYSHTTVSMHITLQIS